MGVAITELLVKKEISLDILRGKTLAVDAHNHLYQFLTTIRQRDGSLLTDNKGNVTSHLVGLLSRTTTLLKGGLKLVYVFDGEAPSLKRSETRRRRDIKEKAAKRYEDAVKRDDEEGMKKYAARTSRLTDEMIAESQKLLEALGVPYVQAPSEGEAQAAYMAKGDCYGVASQDADSLLFGAPVLIKNLSISGRRKMTGKLGYQTVEPEEITLRDTLEHLGISREQLIALAMLVGTDYNPGGIKGIGPQKALKLVKEQKEAEKIFTAAEWEKHSSVAWKEIYDLINTMKTTDNYSISFGPVNKDKAMKLLCDEHDFSAERVEKAIADLSEGEEKRKQKGLLDFT